MDIPSLPTDNLYKFVTISSAVLFCFCVWQEDSILSSIETTIMNTETNQKIVDHYLERNQSEIEYLKNFTSGIKDNPTQSLKDAIANDLEKLIKNNEKIFEMYAENIKVIAKAKIESSRVDRMLPLIRYARNFSIILFCMGILLWWFNHQRFQDLAARREAFKDDRRGQSSDHT